MNETMWMVRAGEGAYLIDEFAKGYVAIGWRAIGDLSDIKDQQQVKKRYKKAYPEAPSSKAGNAAAMIYKFRVLLRKV